MAAPLTTGTGSPVVQTTGEFVIPEDLRKRLVERFDTNTNGTLDTTEVDAAAKRIRQGSSLLDDATKAEMKKRGADLSEVEFGQKFAGALGLKIDNESAVKIAKAYREGLDSPPDKELLEEREKAKKAAGKGKEEKPWWEVLFALVMEMFGMKRQEEQPEQTQTASGGQTPPPKSQITMDLPKERPQGLDMSKIDPSKLFSSPAERALFSNLGATMAGAGEQPQQPSTSAIQLAAGKVSLRGG